MYVVIVIRSGFSMEGFHSSLEHLHVSEIEDILSATLVSQCILCHGFVSHCAHNVT